MKWGVTRQVATGGQIRSARHRVGLQKIAVTQARRNISSATTAKSKANAIQKHADLKMALLNNPDRVIAARLTRGEKIASFLLLTPAGATGLIAGTSAVSRRIEYKQDKNQYTKP
jgi:hypothetical protein